MPHFQNNKQILIFLALVGATALVAFSVYTSSPIRSISTAPTPSVTDTVKKTDHEVEEPQVDVTRVIEGPNSFRFIDEGLGYYFEYPKGWTLAPEPKPAVLKPREEQMVLKKGDVRILIDPLGRRGADEGKSIQYEKLLINDVEWIHTYETTGEYHRFRDENGEITLKSDSTTEGVTSWNQPYNVRNPFRVHINATNADESARSEAVAVTISLLETLETFEDTSEVDTYE